MIYSIEKKILKYLRKSQAHLSNGRFTVDLSYNNYAKEVGKIDKSLFTSSIMNLEKDGFITFETDKKNVFTLTTQAIFYHQYIQKKIVEYIFVKWIDLLALIVSAISLVLAYLAYRNSLLIL